MTGRIAHDVLVDVVVGAGAPVDGRQREALQLVAVEGDVEVGIPLEGMHEVVALDGELHTLVDDGAAIAGQRAGCGRTGGQRHVHDEVGGLLIVPVGIERQAVVEYGEVEAEVGLRSGLPGEVGVGERRLRAGGHGVVVAVLPPLDAVEAVHGEVGVVAQSALVTGLTPAATNLQVVDPRHVLHELLVAHTPCA